MIFWVLPDKGFQTASALDDMLSGFAAGHPAPQVEIRVMTPSSLWKRLFSCLRQSGDAPVPDLVEIPQHWAALFGRLGLFRDLAEFGFEHKANNWPPGAGIYCAPGAQELFSAPWWMELAVLHYRTDFFKHSVSRPEDLLKSWDGFSAACEFLKKKYAAPGFYPLENPNPGGSISTKDVMPCVYGRGGELFTGDSVASGMSRENAVRGVQDYLALAQKGFLPLLREKGGFSGAFSDGGAAMVISRRRAPSCGAEEAWPGTGIRTIQPPSAAAGAKSGFMVLYNLAVLRESENTKDAAALLKRLTGPDVQLKYAQILNAFPRSAGGFESVSGFSEDSSDVYQASLSGAKTFPDSTVAGTYERIMDSMLDKASMEIVRGKYSPAMPADEISKACSKVDYLLSLYG